MAIVIRLSRISAGTEIQDTKIAKVLYTTADPSILRCHSAPVPRISKISGATINGLTCKRRSANLAG